MTASARRRCIGCVEKAVAGAPRFITNPVSTAFKRIVLSPKIF